MAKGKGKKNGKGDSAGGAAGHGGGGGGAGSKKKGKTAKKQKMSKKDDKRSNSKTAAAAGGGKKKKKGGGGGGGGGKKNNFRAAKTSNAAAAAANISSFGPFNVQPISRRQQSKRDQKLYERSQQLAKKRRSGGGGGGSKKAAAAVPHHAFPHGQRTPKHKLGRLGRRTGGGAKISTKAFGRKKFKGKPFAVRLPHERSCPSLKDVPWFDERLMGENSARGVATTSTSTAASSSTRPSSVILPTTGISEEALARLDAELEAFSNYVKLSSVEAEARAYVVEHVRELATQLFQRRTNNNNNNGAGQNKRKRRRRLDTWSDDERDNNSTSRKRDSEGEDGDDGKNDDDTVRVEQFGSFSAPEVCTFLSDVDMALWGVVPPTLPFLGGGAGTHTRFGDDLIADGDGDGGDDDSKDDEAPKLSQSALQRTMDALDAASAARSAALSAKEPTSTGSPLQRWREALADGPSDEVVSDSNAALGSVEEQAGRNGNDAECLFVIDREGDFDADAQQRDVLVAAKTGNNSDDNQPRAVLPNDDAKIEEKKKERIVTNADSDSKDEEKKDGEDMLFSVDREGARALGHEGSGTKDMDANKQHNEAIHFTPVGRNFKSQGDGDDSQSDGKESGAVIDLTKESIEKPSAASQHDGDAASAQAKQQVVESSDNAVAKEPLRVATTDAKTPADQNDVIIINDDEDEESKEAEESNSISNDDNADKMQNFHNREDKSVPDGVPDGKHQYVVDLLSDDSDSDFEDNGHVRLRYSTNTEYPNVEHDDDDDVEVSFVRHQPLVVGPTGKTKEEVVLALKKMGKKLSKASHLTDTVEVRRHAKVPIISMATSLGFDGDIAIAGHNGADTSKYAAAQVRRYESFAHVVLLLKILLYQTELDKPFTGGLGSYKLYVLVAHHLDQHIALAGSDRPSEVFASFLYRYGGIKRFRPQCHIKAATKLDQDVTLTSFDNGHADLSPVFHIEHCTEVFGLCFWRLLNRLQNQNAKGNSSSFLGSMINCTKLDVERRSSLAKADRVRDMKKKKRGSPLIGRDHAGKVGNKPRKIVTTAQDHVPGSTDDEAEKLMAGYGVQRGPRGTLIPRNRPDLAAKRESERNGSDLMGRGSKNRKNKKKQKRDSAVRDFAARSL